SGLRAPSAIPIGAPEPQPLSLTAGIGLPREAAALSHAQSSVFGVREPVRPEAAPTSRRSAMTGSFAAVDRAGAGLAATGSAAAPGATTGSRAGTVSKDRPRTR